MNDTRRAPWWFILIAVIDAAASFLVIGQASEAIRSYIGETGYLSWFYSLYVLLSAVCACMSYRERPLIAWLLLVLQAAVTTCLLLI